MDYRSTLQKLFDLQSFGMKFGLDSMRNLLAKLGNPEKNLKFIHLAGTNGKGSTGAMIAAILQFAGYVTGFYTSPHLVTFRERIQVNGFLITEKEVLELFDQVYQVISTESPPTFFEFVTAMAFIYFAQKKCDFVVLEAGLGGRMDSTNVVDPLICGITNVSLDHTLYLGKDVKTIAAEKAGIIKPGRPFVGGNLSPEALEVIKARLAECNVKGKFSGEGYRYNFLLDYYGLSSIDYYGTVWKLKSLIIPLLGQYQAENAALAIAIVEEIVNLGYELSLLDVFYGFERVSWPGRGEVFMPGFWPPGKLARAPLLLDGAHNPDGAKAFAGFLHSKRPPKLHLIAGVMADKDILGVLLPLLKETTDLYLTRPEYHRAADPEAIRLQLQNHLGGIHLRGVFPHLPEAIHAAAELASNDDWVVISGSLFTVGEALAYLKGGITVDSN
ncbi:MAG: bifunctional folylpolyglutamate synthase/dihydrofolate synthase [Deltaproteobacteria bacterium]|jgi:dihydrofolate synthase/folylpolyglutamate synthase|nr:bifunctional folylpolyglutamate synthase/dihydrofolate synthase [Deltaproteobacteria bacterium]